MVNESLDVRAIKTSKGGMGYLPIKKEAKNNIIRGNTSNDVIDKFFTNEFFNPDLMVEIVFLDLILVSLALGDLNLIKFINSLYSQFSEF